MAAPLNKKSRFNRPAWSKAPTQPSNDEREFFRHSSNGYSDIVAEKSKRREERQRQQRKQQEEEKRQNSDIRESKRRRLSTEDEDEDECRAGKGAARAKAENGDQRNKVPSAGSEAVSKRKDISLRLEPRAPVKVVNLEDEDCKEDTFTAPDSASPIPSGNEKYNPEPKTTQKRLYSEDESEEDDDYMREIKRKAREKERQKRMGLETRPSSTPDNPHEPTRSPSLRDLGSPPALKDVSKTNSSSQIPTVNTHTPPPTEDDPIIEILIQSSIPETKPLLVRRRASQPLAEVRLAWCQRQLFDKAMTSKVFFTWRGNRVFDVTTCRNFLTQTEKENGRDVFETDWESKATESPRIEVIATTQEILEQSRKRQETLKAAADTGEDNIVEADDEPAVSGPVKERKLRIILKSPGMPDVHLKVGPNHHIGKILLAFRQQQGLESGKSVYLLFDGDRLEEDMTVGDVEIEDLDTVDVQVR